MEMEKRAILAAVLALLVLLGYQFIVMKDRKDLTKPTEQIEESKDEGKEAEDIGPSSKEEVIDEKYQIEAQMIDEKGFQIETDKYIAVISDYGARIKSFKLKEYREDVNEDSPPVEMITTKDTGLLPLETTFNRDNIFLEKFLTSGNYKIILNENNKKGELVFYNDFQGILIEKRFIFYYNSYIFGLEVLFKNNTNAPINGAPNIKWYGNDEPKQRYTFTGGVALINKNLVKEDTKKLKKPKIFNGEIKWAGFEDKYFLASIIPWEEDKGVNQLKLSLISNDKIKENILEAELTGSIMEIKPGEERISKYSIYIGPKDSKTLKSLKQDLERVINYGWFDVIAKPLIYILIFLYEHFIRNYGINIILLTVLIKILFFPLTQKSYKSMKEMQKIQPEMLKLREKYKNDKEKLNREMLSLYRRYKVNPLGGCLPMIIQIPVLIALYKALLQAIELRHTPFVWWINDLSSPENIYSFHILGYNLPFRVLPLIMGITMFIQQKMTPTVGDPRQAQMMMWMPVVFTFLFWGFPSGLVLYWLVNNILSIIQQYYINKKSGS